MIAVITTLFSADHRRLANYLVFRTALETAGLRVYTAAAGDDVPGADWLYDLAKNQTLWQKERMLNLAVQQLPSDLDVVAWCDADLIFDCESIAQAITHAARVWPVAQLWQYVTMIGPDARPEAWPGGVLQAESIASYHYQRPGLPIDPRAGHPGFAWVMRRDSWDAMGGLYEYDPSGIADGMMAAAWLGAGAHNPYLRNAPPAMCRHALEWCRQADRVIRGRVGYVPLAIGHLYHGAIRDRQYPERRRQLLAAGYSPTDHVTATSGGLLAWSDAAPRALVAWSTDWLGNAGGKNCCGLAID